ncbi:leucine-rich repeat domain-containing protein [endosymbiont GvMRE of Glomus versiforme]|uniref:leucine-rich repeat domain-containing protein n=1 Tax=endosymbiont GvMRE of Glomus versiforme TaxID=2039283 RepID=UPI000EBC54A4|nr:leucine-rich repeat domain-containing protein [endosymbiont GvMRE of Glomus versiforme]RHZ36413.1 Serine/threonine protein kinase [endosymbiont GvMRE of Glomus versiforme]
MKRTNRRYREGRERERERVEKETINLQQWLDQQYQAKEDKGRIKEIIIGERDRFKSNLTLTKEQAKELEGGNLNLSEYPNLEKLWIWGNYLKTPLTKLELGKKPKLTLLQCSLNQLSTLDLNNCLNLKEVHCWKNELTELKVDKLKKLAELSCSDNQLKSISYPTNPEKLTYLSIENNNLDEHDISTFSKFTNLQELFIGNDDGKKIEENKYNRFLGNLETLEGLTELEKLHISNTNISGSIKCLPKSIKMIYCSSREIPKSQVQKIEEKLKANKIFSIVSEGMYKRIWTDIHDNFAKKDLNDKIYQRYWEEADLTYQEAKKWIKVGFEPKDYKEVKLWKNHNFTSQEVKSWLDIGLDKNDAVFAAYFRYKGYQPSSELKQELEQLKKDGIPAQEYLDWRYPEEIRNEVKYLNISEQYLGGLLKLEEFVNLKVLNCSKNKLTSLQLNCPQLKDLNVSDNEHLAGSLKPFKEMKRLKRLDISNTNISFNMWEYLWFSTKTAFRCTTKLEEIINQLNSLTNYSSQAINYWKHYWEGSYFFAKVNLMKLLIKNS